MSRSSFAMRTGTRITVVLPEFHFRGYVVDELPIPQNYDIAQRLSTL